MHLAIGFSGGNREIAQDSCVITCTFWCDLYQKILFLVVRIYETINTVSGKKAEYFELHSSTIFQSIFTKFVSGS